MKKINFKQPKYILPALLYLPIAFVGYMVIDIFNMDTSKEANSNLKTTDYLSSELPDANTDSILGSKMDNTADMYGNISDLSGVDNIENDRDSVNKKEEYDSRYSDQEAERVARQQAAEEEKRKLREMQNRVRQERKNAHSNDYVAHTSDSEIERVQRLRRQRNWEEMDRDLSGSTRYQARNRRSGLDDDDSTTPGVSYDENGNVTYNGIGQRSSHGGGVEPGMGSEAGDEQVATVKKKTKETSEYFNTIGGNSTESKLISAIVDENIKAVDGSRVRLRLLDDIEIEGITVKKGTYLYATMSGFGHQRVNGTVESIFFDEDIIKVSLTIYDTDGLEGLYVPLSNFKETSKDIISSSLSGGGNILDNNTTSTGIKGWASTAAENISTKAMNALGKAVRKNRVKIKYGTKVYLVDSSSNYQERKRRK